MIIFNPRTSIPLVRKNAGMNSYGTENFKICEKNIVTLNLPHLNIHNTKYPLKSLLKDAIKFGKDGLLLAYSNAFIPHEIEIVSGVLSRIEINSIRKIYGLSDNHIPFAIDLPTTIMGNVKNGEHMFPNIFLFKDDLILVGSNAHSNHPRETNLKFYATTYFYKDRNLAWQQILYKSLNEYSLKNYNISMVLLFSALDIYTKNLFPEENEIQNKICDRLKILGFKNRLRKKFDKNIAKVRNDFEHEHKTINAKEMEKAYECALDIFWEPDENEGSAPNLRKT